MTEPAEGFEHPLPHVSEEVNVTRASETNTEPGVENRCDSRSSTVRRSTRERKRTDGYGDWALRTLQNNILLTDIEVLSRAST